MSQNRCPSSACPRTAVPVPHVPEPRVPSPAICILLLVNEVNLYMQKSICIGTRTCWYWECKCPVISFGTFAKLSCHDGLALHIQQLWEVSLEQSARHHSQLYPVSSVGSILPHSVKPDWSASASPSGDITGQWQRGGTVISRCWPRCCCILFFTPEYMFASCWSMSFSFSSVCCWTSNPCNVTLWQFPDVLIWRYLGDWPLKWSAITQPKVSTLLSSTFIWLAYFQYLQRLVSLQAKEHMHMPTNLCKYWK